MAHDATAFEGDWQLLEEGESLEQADDQHWTLRAGKVFRHALQAGTYEVISDELVVIMAAAAPHEVRFRISCPQPARQNGSTDLVARPDRLSGYIRYPAIDFIVNCVLMRAA
ncbi:MAG: hypothetical protein V4564_22840 [Pseudomonadota bacterium]|uniref:hypothetical protein n=1 Tax=Sphingomonas sp. ERG5 TaxID=1381597 RepID=UPI00054AFCBD|nr:hypothetical protein [Sphingomonas sp. ERG5]